jgi:selenocysteine-specific elongation factor
LGSDPFCFTEEQIALEARLRAAGHEPPLEADLGAEAAHLPVLLDAGRAVRVGPRLWSHPEAVAGVADRVRALVEREGPVTLARLRDDLGTSRKFAQAWLEHLDAARITRRLPDETRIMRRRAG